MQTVLLIVIPQNPRTYLHPGNPPPPQHATPHPVILKQQPTQALLTQDHSERHPQSNTERKTHREGTPLNHQQSAKCISLHEARLMMKISLRKLKFLANDLWLCTFLNPRKGFSAPRSGW